MLNRKRTLFVMIFCFLLGACSSSRDGCPLPPKGFQESDLFGTWDALGESEANTVIIRKDGKYKQSMQASWKGPAFESDWQSWHLTYAENGHPYLHLQGLRMCAYWDQMDCSGNTRITPIRVGDTKDPFSDEAYWYNFCQGKWVETPSEGVFIVMGGATAPPRDIRLVPFTKSADGSSGPSFWLREQ